MIADHHQDEATGWRSYRLFYREFRRHFTATGAIAPSSPALAHAITAPLARPAAGPRRVLEVGAGTGVFTAAILRRLRPGDTLDVYEINPAFRPTLEARIRHARALERGIACRLHVVGICDAPPPEPYDFIVSGLPLNNFSAPDVEHILALFMSLLRPGGVLSYFEYPYLRDLKRALVHDPAERARLRAVGRVVHEFLRHHPRRSVPVPLNLPPAVAHHVRPAVSPA